MEESPPGDLEKPEQPQSKRDWATFKDRLAILGAVIAVLILLFMQIDLAVINFDCSFADFVTFECNRWRFR